MEDRIVEIRQWRRGIEIVSHVNHTQLGRLRVALRGGLRFGSHNTVAQQHDQPDLEADHAHQR